MSEGMGPWEEVSVGVLVALSLGDAVSDAARLAGAAAALGSCEELGQPVAEAQPEASAVAAGRDKAAAGLPVPEAQGEVCSSKALRSLLGEGGAPSERRGEDEALPVSECMGWARRALGLGLGLELGLKTALALRARLGEVVWVGVGLGEGASVEVLLKGAVGAARALLSALALAASADEESGVVEGECARLLELQGLSVCNGEGE
jgi:hypothetical protein